MIKDFQTFINESLSIDDSFTRVTKRELTETFGEDDTNRIFNFFDNKPILYFSEYDEDLAREVNLIITNMLSKDAKYTKHSDYKFYTNPAEGISKLVLNDQDESDLAFFVLEDDVKNIMTKHRGVLKGIKFGI